MKADESCFVFGNIPFLLLHLQRPTSDLPAGSPLSLPQYDTILELSNTMWAFYANGLVWGQYHSNSPLHDSAHFPTVPRSSLHSFMLQTVLRQRPAEAGGLTHFVCKLQSVTDVQLLFPINFLGLPSDLRMRAVKTTTRAFKLRFTRLITMKCQEKASSAQELECGR